MVNRYKLQVSTVAIRHEKGKEVVFHVPAGAEIIVYGSRPLEGNNVLTTPNQQVEVEWSGEHLTMFAADIRKRGRLCAL